MNKKKNIDPNEYYHAENKNAWIKTLGESQAILASIIFSYSRETEIEKDSEIVKWSKNDILVFYTSLMSTSADRLKNINFALKAYANWCIADCIIAPGQNHFEEIEFNDLIKCINKNAINCSYISKESLLGWGGFGEDNLCDLAAIIMLFEGVKGNRCKEILGATFYDIDFDKAQITLNTTTKRIVTFDPIWLPVLKDAMREEEYVLVNGKRMKYCNANIVRAYRKDQEKQSSEIAKVNGLHGRVMKYTERRGVHNLTINSIMVSGQIEYIKKGAMESGMEVNEFILGKECREMIQEKYGVILRKPLDFYLKNQEYFSEV